MIEENANRPGVLDLYRAVLRDAGGWLTAARRRRLAIAIELLLLVGFIAIRSADLGRPWLVGWTLLLAVVGVLAPATGLTAFVAVVPFSEWLLFDRDTGIKVLIPPLLGIGVLIRVLAARQDRRIGLVTALAIGVIVGTGLGVGLAASRFGEDVGFRSLVYWAGGLGGGLTALLVARHAGRAGNVRPLIAATVSIAIAGLASLIDFFDSDLVRTSALRWLMRPSGDPSRLTGIIPAPNAVAALLLTGLAVMVAALVFWRGTRYRAWRMLLVPPVIVSIVAIWFTYSRTGVLGIVLIAVLCAFWWRRSVGALLFIVLLGIAVVAIPAYLQVRAGAVGAGGVTVTGGLLTPSDIERLGAWGAAWRLWLDSPLLGSGTLAFKQVHAAYGSPNITAPHNELIRLLAENGPFVAAAFVALCLRVGSQLWRARTPIALGSLGALGTFLSAGLFNNPLLYVQVTIPVLTVIGIGIGLHVASPLQPTVERYDPPASLGGQGAPNIPP